MNKGFPPPAQRRLSPGFAIRKVDEEDEEMWRMRQR